MNAQVQEMKVTSLAELRKPEPLPLAVVGFGSLQGFELLQRGAKALAASNIIPKDYVGNVANCMVGLEMAERIGVSPLMLMQNMDVIYGRPALRAKFLIATFNQCGRYTTIKYKWQGTQGSDDWGCRATSTEKATGDEIVGPLITIALAKKEGWVEKSGSKWKTIPELMLTYRAAAWMINTTAPEISMGLPTADEIHDVYDAEKDDEGNFVVANVEGLRTVTNAPEVDPQDEALKELERTSSTVTEETVRAKIEAAYKAGDAKLLKIEGDLIRLVNDPEAQNRLAKLFADCQAALS